MAKLSEKYEAIIVFSLKKTEDEIKALRDSVLPYIPNTQIRGQ
mgnify:FL=1